MVLDFSTACIAFSKIIQRGKGILRITINRSRAHAREIEDAEPGEGGGGGDAGHGANFNPPREDFSAPAAE